MPRSASAIIHNSNMATSDTIEAVDVLLTEQDILAFFLSKPGEVKNSELVVHFRPALKRGRHRITNRQQFPRFVNHLANVRVQADGSKILTLKKKFQRRVESATTSDDSNGDVVDRDTAAAATTDDSSQNHGNDEQTTSPAADGEVNGSKRDDMSESEKDANLEEEQCNVEDFALKKLDISHNDNVKGESLANDEQQTQDNDKSSSTGSGDG